jgi:hypothetical protein
MLSYEHHYIILVHGTFNRPKNGKPHWSVYDEKNPENFARRLDDLLGGTSLGQSSENDSQGTRKILTFSWCSHNSHDCRVQAGKKLFHLIRDITKEDPDARIHFVGHSHGGNVILMALQHYYLALASEVRDQNPMTEFLRDFVDSESLSALGESLFKLLNPIWWLKLIGLYIKNIIRAISIGLLREGSILSKKQVEKIRQIFANYHTNRIGKIVFLGTPFVHKRWRKANRFKRLFRSTFDLGILSVYWSLLCYVVLVGLQLILDYINLSEFTWNPIQWPAILQIIAIFYGGWNIWKGYQNRSFQDGNIHFNHLEVERFGQCEAIRPPWNLGDLIDPRIPALVVISIETDEALIGLSSDPLILGVVAAKLRDSVTPKWFMRKNSDCTSRSIKKELVKASGIRGFAGGFRKRLITRSIESISDLVVEVVKAVSYILYRIFVERFTIKLFYQTLSSIATGIGDQEYTDAIIEVDHRPGLKGILSESILEVELNDSGNDNDKKKIKNDDLQIQEEGADPDIDDYCPKGRSLDPEADFWDRIDKELPLLRRHFERENENILREELISLWKKARNRVEAFQGISLEHSKYYEDGHVVEAVAEFLSTGTLYQRQGYIVPDHLHEPGFDASLRAYASSLKSPQLLTGTQSLIGNNIKVSKRKATRSPIIPPSEVIISNFLSNFMTSFRGIDEKRDISSRFITNREYQLFINSYLDKGIYMQPDHWPGSTFPSKRAEDPVVGIRPEDGEQFCRWLESHSEGDFLFRLPRETEIERISHHDVTVAIAWTLSPSGFTLQGQEPQDLLKAFYITNENTVVPLPMTPHLDVGKRVGSEKVTVDIDTVVAIAEGVFARPYGREVKGFVPELLAILTKVVKRCISADFNPSYSSEYCLETAQRFSKELANDRTELSGVFRKIEKAIWKEKFDEACEMLQKLSLHDLILPCHPSTLLLDMLSAGLSTSEREAYDSLQKLSARILEYMWSGIIRRGRFTAKEGRKRVQRLKSLDRLVKIGDTQYWGKALENWCQYYWWFRAAMARRAGELDAWEGLRIVREKRDSI